MRKILLIPDSFKGTMSSGEICRVMKEAVHEYFPFAEIVSIPVADGGEGSVDAFLSAAGGEKVILNVKGPYFKEASSFYGILPDKTAIIEMAAAAGLPMVGDSKHVEKATTFGVGQLIAHAAQAGCKRIIVGLGGSCTNDGGTGAACALGVSFRDSLGKAFVPVGETMGQIAAIDVSRLNPALDGIEIITMCDIDNPFCGPQGAAAVFAPQKGASEAVVKMLDENLMHLAEIIKRDTGKDIRDIAGAGAAGGMGGGMAAFLNSRLQMGIETVLDTVKFDSMLEGADLVISGEGRIDSQSLRGKVVIGVARRAKKAGIPLIAIVGDIGEDIEGAYAEGVCAVFSINRVAVPFYKAKQRCRRDLALTMDNLMRFLSVTGLKKKL
ncbi:glycerate kinase [Ruminiclostridium sufflavum DSM 19573]|uniref:Glycerate kinase n=1 Tax=Ruminiclostridium sufflavum DSM 19573 TaxID=1121337 RepID=A0A318XP73_9FIRM|nr:glycerate kinase [Ruminiclostridium sufflavum]PYG87428.1 glycerate kinase [Ruminiclostridium sufflavum DSM 19573]